VIGLLCFVLAILASPFKSKLRLEAENAVLRHQLIVLKRRLHCHVRLTNHDRWFFIQLYRWFPSILKVLTIIQPETLVRWRAPWAFGTSLFAPASPWQNGVVERLIGSIRRECVDHIIVLGEAHLRRILKSYARYYNRASEHPSVYVVEEKRLC
jgi:Integrase core domain